MDSRSSQCIWSCCTCSASGCYPVLRNMSRCISTALQSALCHIPSKPHISSRCSVALSFSRRYLGCSIYHHIVVLTARLPQNILGTLRKSSDCNDPFSFSHSLSNTFHHTLLSLRCILGNLDMSCCIYPFSPSRSFCRNICQRHIPHRPQDIQDTCCRQTRCIFSPMFWLCVFSSSTILHIHI